MTPLETFFLRFFLSFHDNQPHDHATDGHGRVSREPEQFEAGGYPYEFSDDIPEIGDQDPDHHEKRDAETVFLPKQITQPLAGHGAHTGTHFLHHDQGESDRNHGPQQKMPELRPGGGIGQDAAGIIVDVCGNESRSDYGKEEQDPDLRAPQKLHAHVSKTWG